MGKGTAMKKARWALPVRIQSVARVAVLLDVIADQGPVSLKTISETTALNKTTAFNLLASLEAVGLVHQQEASRRYVLGGLCLRLGKIALAQINLAGAARPSLLRLSSETGETVNLAIPYLFDALIVDSLEGSYGVRATSYSGARSAYHSTACGKAILAFLDSETREELLTRPMPALTPNTITDVARLQQSLIEVQAQGYSIDLEENEICANCVACPIFDQTGEIIGAVSISGPTIRLNTEKLLQSVPLLQRETTQIRERLGRVKLAETDTTVQRETVRAGAR
jgi:IclR family acetate operon transcriptional repressor